MNSITIVALITVGLMVVVKESHGCAKAGEGCNKLSSTINFADINHLYRCCMGCSCNAAIGMGECVQNDSNVPCEKVETHIGNGLNAMGRGLSKLVPKKGKKSEAA